MNTLAILAPAAVLVLWSLVVLQWMVITRFKAFSQAGFKLAEAPVGDRYVDREPSMPVKVNWVSHNYTHLMEQPTIYYAVIAVLALAGDTSGFNLTLAWTYTCLRVLHSLWQGISNVIMVRVILFILSTLCLWGLAINAVRVTLF